MKPLLYAALAAYVVAAIHAILTFVTKRRSLERVTTGSLACGFAAHTAALIVDWVQEGHYPLFHLHETISFLAWTLVVAYGLAVYRYRTHALGVFLLPLVSVLVLISNFALGDEGRHVGRITEGDAAWLFPVHTTLLIFAYASFFVAFAASVMYLWQERELKQKTFSAVFHRLPSLTTVDDIGTSAAAIGFTLLTLGIITGVVWSSARNGHIWHNDPVEFFALLTWVLYLTLLHYRTQWRGRRAAWLGIAGFALVLCTFIGAFVLGGYHVFG
ncbi:MAG TPA: cytochrome c biogenesis protein CcsA [Pyrinomonadaceae bacterium]|nr:cytochrome c biogenesis protein CcsA [Pyrinomonadaceae bacterium]